MTQTEIKTALSLFGANNVRFDNFIYCATLLGWLKAVRKGNHIFFVAVAGGRALDYNFKDGVAFKEKVRWRNDVREYWEAHDRPRFNAFAELVAEAATR